MTVTALAMYTNKNANSPASPSHSASSSSHSVSSSIPSIPSSASSSSSFFVGVPSFSTTPTQATFSSTSLLSAYSAAPALALGSSPGFVSVSSTKSQWQWQPLSQYSQSQLQSQLQPQDQFVQGSSSSNSTSLMSNQGTTGPVGSLSRPSTMNLSLGALPSMMSLLVPMPMDVDMDVAMDGSSNQSGLGSGNGASRRSESGTRPGTPGNVSTLKVSVTKEGAEGFGATTSSNEKQKEKESSIERKREIARKQGLHLKNLPKPRGLWKVRGSIGNMSIVSGGGKAKAALPNSSSPTGTPPPTASSSNGNVSSGSGNSREKTLKDRAREEKEAMDRARNTIVALTGEYDFQMKYPGIGPYGYEYEKEWGYLSGSIRGKSKEEKGKSARRKSSGGVEGVPLKRKRERGRRESGRNRCDECDVEIDECDSDCSYDGGDISDCSSAYSSFSEDSNNGRLSRTRTRGGSRSGYDSDRSISSSESLVLSITSSRKKQKTSRSGFRSSSMSSRCSSASSGSAYSNKSNSTSSSWDKSDSNYAGLFSPDFQLLPEGRARHREEHQDLRYFSSPTSEELSNSSLTVKNPNLEGSSYQGVLFNGASASNSNSIGGELLSGQQQQNLLGLLDSQQDRDQQEAKGSVAPGAQGRQSGDYFSSDHHHYKGTSSSRHYRPPSSRTLTAGNRRQEVSDLGDLSSLSTTAASDITISALSGTADAEHSNTKSVQVHQQGRHSRYSTSHYQHNHNHNHYNHSHPKHTHANKNNTASNAGKNENGPSSSSSTLIGFGSVTSPPATVETSVSSSHSQGYSRSSRNTHQTDTPGQSNLNSHTRNHSHTHAHPHPHQHHNHHHQHHHHHHSSSSGVTRTATGISFKATTVTRSKLMDTSSITSGGGISGVVDPARVGSGVGLQRRESTGASVKEKDRDEAMASVGHVLKKPRGLAAVRGKKASVSKGVKNVKSMSIAAGVNVAGSASVSSPVKAKVPDSISLSNTTSSRAALGDDRDVDTEETDEDENTANFSLDPSELDSDEERAALAAAEMAARRNAPGGEDKNDQQMTVDLEDWEDLKELFGKATEMYESAPPSQTLPLLRGVIHECHRFMLSYPDPSVLYSGPLLSSSLTSSPFTVRSQTYHEGKHSGEDPSASTNRMRKERERQREKQRQEEEEEMRKLEEERERAMKEMMTDRPSMSRTITNTSASSTMSTCSSVSMKSTGSGIGEKRLVRDWLEDYGPPVDVPDSEVFTVKGDSSSSGRVSRTIGPDDDMPMDRITTPTNRIHGKEKSKHRHHHHHHHHKQGHTHRKRGRGDVSERYVNAQTQVDDDASTAHILTPAASQTPISYDLPTAFYTLLGSTLFFFGCLIDANPQLVMPGEPPRGMPYWLSALDVFEIGENLPVRTRGLVGPGAGISSGAISPPGFVPLTSGSGGYRYFYPSGPGSSGGYKFGDGAESTAQAHAQSQAAAAQLASTNITPPIIHEDWKMAIMWGRTLVCVAEEVVKREREAKKRADEEGGGQKKTRSEAEEDNEDQWNKYPSPFPVSISPKAWKRGHAKGSLKDRKGKGKRKSRDSSESDDDDKHESDPDEPTWPPNSPFAAIAARRPPLRSRVSLKDGGEAASPHGLLMLAQDQFSRGILHMPHPTTGHYHSRKLQISSESDSLLGKDTPFLFTPELGPFLKSEEEKKASNTASTVGSNKSVQASGYSLSGPIQGLITPPPSSFSRVKELYTIAYEVLLLSEKLESPEARQTWAHYADSVFSQMKMEVDGIPEGWWWRGHITAARGRCAVIIGSAMAEEVEERLDGGEGNMGTEDEILDSEEAEEAREVLSEAISHLERAKEEFEERTSESSPPEGSSKANVPPTPSSEEIEELKALLAEALLSLANLTKDEKEREELYTRAKKEGGEKVELEEMDWEGEHLEGDDEMDED